jgi:acetyl-CoA acetyltransferase
VGVTEQGELPGRSANEIAVEAFSNALTDSGLSKDRIDGLITCKSAGGWGVDTQIGSLIGLNPRYSATLDYGACNFSLHLAVMVIESGMAETVAIMYGTNQRSMRRSFASADGTDMSLLWPYGFMNIAGVHALAFRRRQYLYGTTEEQLGHVAVVERRHAQLNPLAVFRDPLTIDDYLASRYIVRPLRRPDICMVSDGGAALVVTSAERANGYHDKPVYVRGVAEQAALRYLQNPDHLLRPWAEPVAETVFHDAGVSRTDIDVLFIQDATSLAVLEALEIYGYCGRGEAGEFVASGRIALGGEIPVNTNGGQLSESYLWGWLHLCEAVRQLRGQCGDRQVLNAQFAHYCSNMGYRKVASSILANIL